MQTRLVFATNNQHKLREVQQIISCTSSSLSILSLADIQCREDIPETSDTLQGNALLKARFVKDNYGYDCFADDTGLEVEALHNAPGVYSARYAGIEQDSEANTRKLLTEMQGKDNRKARFRTVIALILDDREYLFEGIINGRIITGSRGAAGFGYDPVFVPDGYLQTFAELGDELKNTISHRALATKKLATFLSSIT
jgi:XTP/dITP diphosphohydrolase